MKAPFRTKVVIVACIVAAMLAGSAVFYPKANAATLPYHPSANIDQFDYQFK